MTTKREWFFVIIISVFVIIFANIAVIHGYLIAPTGKLFWDATSFIDTNTYLAWMKQAAEGNVLFKDLYTSEPHARSFFHPFFLILGFFSSVTSISVRTVDYFARLLSEIGALIVLYLFISYFIQKKAERILTFAVTVFSGGFGFLFFIPSIKRLKDSWYIAFWGESNTFFSISGYTIYPFSLMLLFLAFYLMLRSFEENSNKLAIYSGLVALMLLFTHFYDTLIVYPVLFTYLICKYFIGKDFEKLKSGAIKLLIFTVISLPAPLYNFYLSFINPIFKVWAWEYGQRLSVNIFWVFGAMGFVGIFAIGGIFYLLFIKGSIDNKMLFLIVWALLTPFLIYFPVSIQRRLIEGVHVALSILTCIFIFFLADRFRLNKVLFVIVFIAISIPALFIVPVDRIMTLTRYAQSSDIAGFLNVELLDAMKWLDTNTESDDVVFCDYETGNYIPAVSGNTVFLGHPDQTLNFTEKWDLQKKFFREDVTDEFRISVLKRARARYLVYGWKEKSLGDFNPDTAGYLKLVYNKGRVKIYKVENYEE